VAALAPGLLDDQQKHWNEFFDYSNSCVNEAFKSWSPDGRRLPEDDAFGYSPLDLFLMGAAGEDRLTDLRFFDPTPGADGTHKGRALPIAQFLAAIGGRRPKPSNAALAFHLAFVVVTADLESGNRLAKRIDDFRPIIETKFAAGCTLPGSGAKPIATLNTARV
jgi:hypothetical protein